MNIKALAEQIKKNYEAQPDWAEHKIENVSYRLASALLRVMEDGENLKKDLTERKRYYTEQWLKTENVAVKSHIGAHIDELNNVLGDLESHNKLMEELGGE